MTSEKQEKPMLVELLSPLDVSLVRYIKIRASSNPFDMIYSAYFAMRRKAKNYQPLNANNLTAGLPLNEGLQGA